MHEKKIICKNVVVTGTPVVVEAEEKSQVVIQKTGASLSNGKNDDRAQNSLLLLALLPSRKGSENSKE